MIIYRKALPAVVVICLLGAGIAEVAGRELYEPSGTIAAKIGSDVPYTEVAVHNIGKLGIAISNRGNFGTGFIGDVVDPVTGEAAPSGNYPYPGNLQYHYSGCFWVGAVVGRDTLVSVGADGWHPIMEMWPDPYPKGEIIRRSISDEDDTAAVSEQDFIAIYTDTLTNPSYVASDDFEGRPHHPLNIEITQKSYAWSYSYAEDFTLFDYEIKNIGRRNLEKVYMGIYVDGDVHYQGATSGFKDDISGFKESVPAPEGCGFLDTIRIAYIADNNGRDDDNQGCPTTFDFTSVTGVRVVRTPSDSLKFSYNWWISNGEDPQDDFGPRKVGTPNDPFRDFGGFLGTPMGDKNKYYIMRHVEFDYDQLFTALDHSADGWLPPPAAAAVYAKGYDTRYLLSFGPFDINPGEVLPISFAYVAAEDFHTDCDAYQRLFSPYHPEDYYDQLGFEDFGLNARWADWIYDNPGVDTDGDGLDSGLYRICAMESILVYDTIVTDTGIIIEKHYEYTLADTMWYKGDGVPDFRGASPPPPPDFKIYPRIDEYHRGEFTLRWNGFRTETAKDVFSQKIDFEGYRVYFSVSPMISEFVLLSSFDIQDYNKYTWNSSRRLWELRDPPFSIDSLRELYGPGFSPEYYHRDNPFYWIDSVFYFISQDWNQSDLRDTTCIYKLYPDEPPPTVLNLDSAAANHPEELTEEGQFKYFEYAYKIPSLLPSQLYYVSITAFDYGAPSSGLQALESRISLNMISEYAQNQTSLVEQEQLEVIVYPNPYRNDGEYRRNGFEGRGHGDLPDDRVRTIHFTNLPHKCTIRIFSIDGDLIREIDHDYPLDDPKSMHDTWDVITRNTQPPASGIYYYSVESEYGSQLGKIVLIM
nr:hypothetical protein [candidate division Zixibacteria bacterium]